MYNNFFLLLSAFFTAGSLGFINYFILEKLNILIFQKSNENDKKHFLLFFSLLNYAIYLLIYLLLKKITNLGELSNISVSIFLTLSLTILLSLFIFPYVAEKFSDLLNSFRKNSNLSELEHNSPRDLMFDNKKMQSVFIFDFDKNLISSGYLEYRSDQSDYYEIILIPFDGKPRLDDYDKVEEYFQSDNGQENNPRILLDFEKKIQYFIIDGNN